MTDSGFYRVAKWAAVLAFAVVVLGAYTRLSDAGLGCPDWPGCYGQLMVPGDQQAISQANVNFPERPVEAPKAWKEMIHRYFAGTLGLLVLALAVIAWRNRHQEDQPVRLPIFLVGLVILQALLGMWTVTLLLKPVVVTAHLLGGMATLGLLSWLALRTGPLLPMKEAHALRTLRPWALLALLIIGLQIALGGWTSANYAALACGNDFPACLGQWWPSMDFGEALVFWRGLGVNYEFGVLENEARVAIQMMHRIGFVVTFLYLGWLVVRLIANGRSQVARNIGILIATVLLIQIGLGVANVVLDLPLLVATAHNALAALLLLTVILLNHSLRPRLRS